MKKEEGFYGWISLSTAAFSFFILAGIVGSSFGAFLPVLAADFGPLGWSFAKIGLAAALMGLLTTLISPIAAILIGKYGPRRIIAFGSALVVVAFLFLFLQSTYGQLQYWQFLGAYIVIGLGIGFGGVVASTTIAANWFRRKTPLAMSVVTSSGNLGGLVSQLCMVLLIAAIGWKSTYGVLSVIVLLCSAIIPILFLKNKPEDLGQVPDGKLTSKTEKEHGAPKVSFTSVSFTGGEALKTSAFWMLIIFSSVPIYIMLFLMAHQINFLQGLGIDIKYAALTNGVISGVSILGGLAMGFLTFKFDVKKLAFITATLMLISMVIAYFTQSILMALIFSAVLGLGAGAAFVTLTTFMPAYFGPVYFHKIIGFAMFFGAVAAVGPLVGGLLYDKYGSYQPAFLVAMGVSTIGMICVLLLKAPVHPSLKKK